MIKGGGIADSKSSFCMDIVEQASQIQNMCPISILGTWKTNYGAWKKNFFIFDRRSGKTVPCHVNLTNQRTQGVYMSATYSSIILITNHVDVQQTTGRKIHIFGAKLDFFARKFQRLRNYVIKPNHWSQIDGAILLPSKPSHYTPTEFSANGSLVVEN